jgi:hypothetical protein
MRHAQFFVSVVLAIGWTNTVRAQSNVEGILAQSEPTIQDQIKRVDDALSEQPELDLRSNVAALQEVQLLKNSVADKGEIVKQLAIFAATPTDDEGRPLMALGIMHLLDLPPKIVIRVLAPYLNADNMNLRSFVRDWFQGHDNAAAPGPGLPPLQPVNYEDYMNYVRGLLNLRQQVPTAFVEYIYERSPDRALLVFYYGSKQVGRPSDILWGEHVVSNALWLKENGFEERYQKALPEAATELAKLSKYDEWWARLYVVEIMRRYPELRQVAVIEQLRKDGNAFVSKGAKSVKE